MGKLVCSLAIALLLATAVVARAGQPLAAIAPSNPKIVAPSAVTASKPVPPMPAPARTAPATGAPRPSVPGQSATVPAAGSAEAKTAGAPTGAPAGAKGAGAATTAQPGTAAGEPGVVEMTKLKHQIKTVRLSLADTQGRLAVTEKDLTTATTENAQLRSDNVSLRVGLAKAETVAKKSEDELGHRRQEVKTLQTARPTGWGVLAVGLLFSVAISGLMALLLFYQGGKLGTIADRIEDEQAQGKRHEQLQAQLKEEQQRAQRLEDESLRLRALAENQTKAPAGSKREKLEQLRRELRDARAAAEADKRQADERIEKLEAELARITADKQQVEERVAKLEPEMAELAAQKQQLVEHAQKLEPQVERLTVEKAEAEERSRQLAHDAARLMAEKLRLQHALAKANEKLVFLGHDEPEDTLPPVVG
jgi:predicted  nucleic acid-binding Zn-ribbon protein